MKLLCFCYDDARRLETRAPAELEWERG